MTRVLRVNQSVFDIARSAGRTMPEAAAVALAASAGARAAKRAGDEFEDELEQTHQAYGAWVALQRGNISTVRIRGELRATGKSGVDFIGVARSFPVAFDAKSFSGVASFQLRDLHKKRSSDRAEVQFLKSFSLAGGLAFYLVRDPSLGRVYLVDSSYFAALEAGESVPLREHHRAHHPFPAPLVPCLQVTSREQIQRTAAGQPLWPWLSLIPEIAR